MASESEEHRKQIARNLRPYFELRSKIESIVETLLGDIHERSPDALREVFERNGIPVERLDEMTGEELSAHFERSRPRHATPDDDLIAALDLLFQARYGWKEGSAERMTLKQLLLALDHALEYDAPSRPSIWDMTK